MLQFRKGKLEGLVQGLPSIKHLAQGLGCRQPAADRGPIHAQSGWPLSQSRADTRLRPGACREAMASAP